MEILEDRCTPATLTVNSLLDLAVNLSDTTVTLRDAIYAANNNLQVAPGGPTGGASDIIDFDATVFAGEKTINLSIIGDNSSANSAFAITSDITIRGTAANRLTLKAPWDPGQTEPNPATNMRHFLVASTGTLTLEDLTLSGGFTPNLSEFGPWFDAGGAIHNKGTTTIDRVMVLDNLSNSTFGGGGIYTDESTLTIRNSTIARNRADFFGRDNAADGPGRGGGITMEGGTVSILNSTVSGNRAAGDGGGIYAIWTGTLTIINSTITQNDTDFDSAGAGTGALHQRHDTIAVTMHNTIVVGNTKAGNPTNSQADLSVRGPFVEGSSNNLVGLVIRFGSMDDGVVDGVNGNKVGVAYAGVLDLTLADNGGPTITHALLPGSLAYDAGNDTAPASLSNDQRGTGFLRKVSTHVDIGAFEVQNQPPAGADKAIEIVWNTIYTFTVADFGFSDPDSHTMAAATITTLPALGSLTYNSTAVQAGQSISITDINNGSLKFTPATGETGAPYTSFTFQVQDNGPDGGSLDPTPNTLSFNVTDGNRPPTTPPNKTYNVRMNKTLSVKRTIGLLVGSTDPDGDPITAVIVTPPSSGVLKVKPDGSFKFKPPKKFEGTLTFTYQISDGKGGLSELVTITLNVARGRSKILWYW